MMKPTIHLNGTDRAELLGQYSAAYLQVRRALDAVVAASPHGRDYYPQGGGAYQIAAREHALRIAKLQTVLDELSVLRLHAMGEE